jgi:molybdenum cofactor synthesis domain-containing protein
MVTARLLTIGTEITNGEVTNSNAAWISRNLEEMGVRVLSHLSVRDNKEEILQALRWGEGDELLFITGGLGPTSDDITRDCVAEYAGLELEFDEGVWRQLEDVYRRRGLALREAHKQQCFFPIGSERLANTVGTALGFYLKSGKRSIFVMPGPPRELEGMWVEEVDRRVRPMIAANPKRWIRWTCLGAPESEVAEVVEPVIQGHDVEVGYRAQVPYVRVKIFAPPDSALIAKLEEAMKPWIVARGEEDIAEELIRAWPGPKLTVRDSVCGPRLYERLDWARLKTGTKLQIDFHTSGGGEPHIEVSAAGEEAIVQIALPDGRKIEERKTLPYKVALASERGRKSIVEWVLWYALRAVSRQSET